MPQSRQCAGIDIEAFYHFVLSGELGVPRDEISAIPSHTSLSRF
jgi:hypothetical protein